MKKKTIDTNRYRRFCEGAYDTNDSTAAFTAAEVRSTIRLGTISE